MPIKTSFIIVNENKDIPLLIYLEPEGFEFALPYQEEIIVHQIYEKEPVSIFYSVTPQGEPALSLWPKDGSFEIFYKDKNVWDIILPD